MDLAALRQAIRDGRYRFSVHAAGRMVERRIALAEALAVVELGSVVEEHPDNKPHPKVLLMARIGGEPLYVSCAFDGRYAYIITVHWYDDRFWNDPWTRRKN